MSIHLIIKSMNFLDKHCHYNEIWLYKYFRIYFSSSPFHFVFSSFVIGKTQPSPALFLSKSVVGPAWNRSCKDQMGLEQTRRVQPMDHQHTTGGGCTVADSSESYIADNDTIKFSTYSFKFLEATRFQRSIFILICRNPTKLVGKFVQG